jgi:hypothetical protein
VNLCEFLLLLSFLHDTPPIKCARAQCKCKPFLCARMTASEAARPLPSSSPKKRRRLPTVARRLAETARNACDLCRGAAWCARRAAGAKSAGLQAAAAAAAAAAALPRTRAKIPELKCTRPPQQSWHT